MNAAPHESRSKVSPMQVPWAVKHGECPNPSSLTFGRHPLIRTKNAECCNKAITRHENPARRD
jgi:hypothetical protein